MLPARKSVPRSSRQSDHARTYTCTETQTEVVWRYLPFIISSQTISQGTTKGGKRQGRQKKRLEDNVREWTGLEFAKTKRAVENREK